MDIVSLAANHGDWTLTIAGCGFIILFAFGFGISQYLKIAHIKRSLSSGISLLRNANPIDPAMWSKVSVALNSNDLFREIEPTYSSEILPRESVDECSQREGFAIYALQAPSHFFNEDSLYLAHFNAQFFNAIPNILTGLGILFTFIGLCLGLKSVNTSTAQDLVQSITPLLNGASLAFVTSIAGLFFSILYTFYNHYSRHAVLSLINEFNLVLQQRVYVLTIEDCFHDMHGQLKQQTVIMNTFAADWQMQIKDILTEVFTAQAQANEKETTRVVGAIDTVTESLNKIGQLQSEQIADLLDESLQGLSQKLTQAIQGMSTTFAETAHSVSETVNLLDTTLVKMQETVLGLGEATSAAVAQIAASTATTKEHIESSAETVSHATDGVCDKLVTLSNDMQTHMDAFTQKAVEAGDLFSGAANKAGNYFSEATAKASDHWSQATVQASEQFSESISQAADGFKQAVDGFAEKAGEAGELFSVRASVAGKQFSEATSTAADYLSKETIHASDQFSESISQASEGFKHAVEGFSEATNTAAEHLSQETIRASEQFSESLSQVNAEFKATAQNFRNSVALSSDTFRENIKSAGASLKSVLEPSLKSVVSFTEKLQTVRQDLDKTQVRYSEAISIVTELGNRLQEAVDQLGEHMESSVSAAGEIQQTLSDQLGETADSLLSEIQEMTRVQSDLTRNSEQLQALMDESLTSLAESMKTMNDQLKNNLNEADQDLARSVSILSESYDGLREHIQTVFKDLKAEVDEIRNENKRLTRYREEVTQLVKEAQAGKGKNSVFS